MSVDRSLTLLPQTTIAAAMAGVVSDPVMLGPLGYDPYGLTAQAVFVYGSGGTTAKVWVQTSLDGGLTWVDIMNFAFATATVTKFSSINIGIAVAAAITPTDGTLGDNLIVNGLLGDRIRLKRTTTGTYAGATSLKVTAVPR